MGFIFDSRHICPTCLRKETNIYWIKSKKCKKKTHKQLSFYMVEKPDLRIEIMFIDENRTDASQYANNVTIDDPVNECKEWRVQ